MAGIIKVDRVQSDSNLAFNIAGANVAFMDSTNLRMVTANLSLAGTNVISNGKVTTSAQPVGAVLQVVQNTFSTSVGTSSTTYVDTGLTVSITPTSSTSKILVVVTALSSAAGSQGINSSSSWNIVRNTTQLMETVQRTYSYAGGAAGIYTSLPTASAFLDSPATTSTTTYKVQQKCNTAANAYINGDGGTSVITVMEIAA